MFHSKRNKNIFYGEVLSFDLNPHGSPLDFQDLRKNTEKTSVSKPFCRQELFIKKAFSKTIPRTFDPCFPSFKVTGKKTMHPTIPTIAFAEPQNSFKKAFQKRYKPVFGQKQHTHNYTLPGFGTPVLGQIENIDKPKDYGIPLGFAGTSLNWKRIRISG